VVAVVGIPAGNPVHNLELIKKEIEKQLKFYTKIIY